MKRILDCSCREKGVLFRNPKVLSFSRLSGLLAFSNHKADCKVASIKVPFFKPEGMVLCRERMDGFLQVQVKE